MIGLVISGGGGKGAYFLGVWRALREFGVEGRITAVSGASIGALNAVLFAQKDYILSRHIWLSNPHNVTFSVDVQRIRDSVKDIFKMSKMDSNKTNIKEVGVFSRDGLMATMDKYIDFSIIQNCNINLYAAASRLDTGDPEYFRLNNFDKDRIKKILCASSAIPVIYGAEEIDGIKYVDGGVSDNIPLRPLLEENINTFIVVHYKGKNVINKKDYANESIIEIHPPKDMGNNMSILDFSKSSVENRIMQGYTDARRILLKNSSILGI